MTEKKSILEILETDTDTAHKLRNLKGYVGWKLLAEILIKNEVEPLSDRLRNFDYKTIEERNRDKDKLDNLETLLNAPSFYIEALTTDPDKKEPTTDPYASTIEQAQEVAHPTAH